MYIHNQTGMIDRDDRQEFGFNDKWSEKLQDMSGRGFLEIDKQERRLPLPVRDGKEMQLIQNGDFSVAVMENTTEIIMEIGIGPDIEKKISHSGSYPHNCWRFPDKGMEIVCIREEN
jgi:hypothetical protein